MKRTILDLLRRIAMCCGFAVLLTALGCGTSVDRATAEADIEQEADVEEAPAPVRMLPRLTVSKSRKTTDDTTSTSTKQARIATPLPVHFPSTYASDVPSADRVLARPVMAEVVAQPTRPQTIEKAATPKPTIDAAAASRQADEQVRRAVAATAKGAWFTARTEFNAALQTVAVMHDSHNPAGRHEEALQAALTALKEAEDFMSRSSHGGASINVTTIVAGHRTSAFVEPMNSSTSATAARATYLQFARDRLADAAAGNVTASVALHGLGKIHAATSATTVDARGKAQAFYEAALVAGPGNFLAANDLAVLLAEEGQLERARDVLHAGLRQSSQPAMWTNLAAVHDRLGEPKMADLARREAATLERQASAGGTVLPTHNVAWLDPRQFAATSRQAADASQASAVSSAAAPAAAAPAAAPATPATPPGRWAQRPMNRALAY